MGCQVQEKFDNLSTGSDDRKKRLDEIWAEATEIFKPVMNRNPDIAENKSFVEEEITKIFAVLIKWKTNQFAFQNGSGSGSSALFAFASRLNHSCNPTARLESQWSPLISGALQTGDGRMEARAARDI